MFASRWQDFKRITLYYMLNPMNRVAPLNVISHCAPATDKKRNNKPTKQEERDAVNCVSHRSAYGLVSDLRLCILLCF
jgi:hypothetical protein